MFLIKSLDDLLKESGATLEATVPGVAQSEADEQSVSTTRLEEMEAERGVGVVEHYDGMGAYSLGQWTVQARLRVEHWGTVGEGSVVY